MEGDLKKHKIDDRLTELDLRIAQALETITKVDPVNMYHPDLWPQRICFYKRMAKSSDTDYYVNKK